MNRKNRSIELKPWLKITIVLAVVLLLAIAIMLVAVLTIISSDDDDDDSSSSDDHSETICSESFIRRLYGSKWQGNATSLRPTNILIENTQSLVFLRRVPVSGERIPRGGFYYNNSFVSFDPVTGKQAFSGFNLFAGWLHISESGSCTIEAAELKPEADSFSNLRFLEYDRMDFSVLESTDSSTSMALHGQLMRVS